MVDESRQPGKGNLACWTAHVPGLTIPAMNSPRSARRWSVWLLAILVAGAAALASAPAARAQPGGDDGQPAGTDGAGTTQPAAPPASASPPGKPADLPEVVIYLKSGQRISGLLVNVESKQIVVRVAGINTRLPMESIQRYDVLPPILERYQELRKTIGNDPEDIVRLAQWLQSREQYALALSEVGRALEREPTNGEALRLKAILEQQLILQVRGRTSVQPDKPAPEAANPPRPKPSDFPLLSGEDINLIKVYEIDLAARPHVVIPREVAKRMLEAHTGHPLIPITREGREAILRRPPLEILDLMFKLQAREFYRDVEVIDQPASIRMFRDEVERTWLMSCATSQCHGGLEAGRFVLYNRSPNSDPAVFTNLLILQRFRTRIGADPDAASESGGRHTPFGKPLIDWDQPEMSPLLQLGLPREDSLFPHPPVPRDGPDGPRTGGGDIWKPEFRSTDDRLFKKAAEWIRSMYRPRPSYPIDYTPLRPFEPEPPLAPAGSDRLGTGAGGTPVAPAEPVPR